MSKKKLVSDGNGGYKWVNCDGEYTNKPRPMNAQGEDLTVQGYIDKHGGIYSHADCKIHYSKQSYMDGLKEKGCTIKDW